MGSRREGVRAAEASGNLHLHIKHPSENIAGIKGLRIVVVRRCSWRVRERIKSCKRSRRCKTEFEFWWWNFSGWIWCKLHQLTDYLVVVSQRIHLDQTSSRFPTPITSPRRNRLYCVEAWEPRSIASRMISCRARLKINFWRQLGKRFCVIINLLKKSNIAYDPSAWVERVKMLIEIYLKIIEMQIRSATLLCQSKFVQF